MHLQTQHRVDKWGLGSERYDADGGDKPRTYRMAFPVRAGPRPFLVKGCSVQALMGTNMRVNLWHRHGRDTVVILEEGNLPHPLCPLCDILVPWKSLNEMHRRTAQCTQGAEWKRRQLAAEEDKEVTVRDFSAYGRPPGDGYLLQISRAGDLGGGQKLAGGGEERVPGKEVLEKDVAHPQQGGIGAAGVRILF